MKDYKYVRRTLVDMFYNTLDRQKYSEVCADTLEAVNRQIPKKLTVSAGIYSCPRCGENAAVLQGDNYCFNCGQALDWSDTK